jgi:hypothetical protein
MPAMSSDDREKPGKKVDEKLLQTIGKLLDNKYKADLQSKLPPELASLMDRLRSKLD